MARPTRVTRAKPITPEILLKLREHIDQSPTLRNWRTTWRIFVGYYCMLRWSDVSKLKVSDLELLDGDCYRINMSGGKTG